MIVNSNGKCSMGRKEVTRKVVALCGEEVMGLISENVEKSRDL